MDDDPDPQMGTKPRRWWKKGAQLLDQIRLPIPNDFRTTQGKRTARFLLDSE